MSRVLARWLRALADRLDPPPIRAYWGGVRLTSSPYSFSTPGNVTFTIAGNTIGGTDGEEQE